MYSCDELFLRSLECYFGVYLFFIFIDWNKHQNNTLVSAKTVHHSSTYIIISIYDVISTATIHEYNTL